jgi:hypothetical protein
MRDGLPPPDKDGGRPKNNGAGFYLAERTESTRRAKVRKWSNGVFSTANPCARILLRPSFNRPLATGPMAMNRKAWALFLAMGKSSIAAENVPEAVWIPISANVPEANRLSRRTVPPVRDNIWRVPLSFSAPTETTACSLFGTTNLGERDRLCCFFILDIAPANMLEAKW